MQSPHALEHKTIFNVIDFNTSVQVIFNQLYASAEPVDKMLAKNVVKKILAT